MKSAEEIARALPSFTGTSHWYRDYWNRIVYTDGVKYFIDSAEAYWFLTEIVSILPKLPRDSFYSVELMVKNSAAVITVDDGNDHILLSKTITFTDAPEGLWKFYLEEIDACRFCLLLPSEH